MSQIFSTIISNLVIGELIQAKKDFKQQSMVEDKKLIPLIDIENFFKQYIAKTYYKTASMISLGCRGIGLIFSLDVHN